MNEMIIGSLLSAMATGIGAIPILFFKNMNHRKRDGILAFTAGVMLSASLYSLIPESLAQSNFIILLIGLLLGAGVLSILEEKLPHIEMTHEREEKKGLQHQTLLIIAALVLHNIPEGLSVGVSYASEQVELGPVIALAIGFQNAPEGFLVALFLIQEKMNRWKALMIATLTGMIEMVASLFGYGISRLVEEIVPMGLAFAAGAMLYIIFVELIPESHGDGNHKPSTYSFIVGIVVMLFIVEIF